MASPAEFSEYSFQKRFNATHYSYRDSAEVTTVILTEAACLGYLATPALASQVYYLFGTNARGGMVGNMYAWPNAGDTIGPIQPSLFQTYARKVSFRATTASHVRLISLNPEYLRKAILISYKLPITQIAQTIMEQEIAVPATTATFNGEIIVYPTYAIAVVFRADAGIGTLYITAEGNCEGSE